MKRDLLHNIATIRFGINARTNDYDNIPCIQGKDFDDHGRLINDNIFFTSSDFVKDRDFLRENDILFPSKGFRSYSIVWNNEINNAVASSTFLILRAKTHEILPAYLAWYLQSPIAEKYIKTYKTEGTIPTINKKAIELLEVNIPSIEMQKNIIQINYLGLKEKEICKSLNQKKEILSNQIINNFLSEKTILK